MQYTATQRRFTQRSGALTRHRGCIDRSTQGLCAAEQNTDAGKPRSDTAKRGAGAARGSKDVAVRGGLLHGTQAQRTETAGDHAAESCLSVLRPVSVDAKQCRPWCSDPLKLDKRGSRTRPCPPRRKTTATGAGYSLADPEVLIGAVLSRQGRTTEAPKQHKLRIGLSFDTLKEERWQRIAQRSVKRATELGAEVVDLAANSSDTQQM